MTLAIPSAKAPLAEDFIDRPASFNPVSDSLFTTAYFQRPFADAQRFAIQRQTAMRWFVVLLLLLRSPSAIARRISEIAVNAVNGMLRGWPMAHVAHERREAVAPALADRDASRSVFPVAGVFRILATANDAYPHIVFARLAHAVLRVARKANVPLLLNVETAAGARAAFGQALPNDYAMVSA